MKTNESIDDRECSEIDLAYARAALYSALAIGFQAPTAENLARLLKPENRAALLSAARQLYPAGEPDLTTVIETFPNFTDDCLSVIAARHRELFGHTVRSPVPPYETEYGNEALFQLPHELGDLMGFYRAFGLILKPGLHERADHISCECEFLMFLALKECYALEHEDREMLAEVEKAERLFLRDHLGRFLPTFESKLRRHEASGFYGLLATLCLGLVTAECRRLEVPAATANLDLRPDDDDRVPMACGSGAQCGAMPGACVPEEAESV